MNNLDKIKNSEVSANNLENQNKSLPEVFEELERSRKIKI